MNRLHKVFGFLMAGILLAAFALPSMAGSGTKNFIAEFPTVSATSKISMIMHNVSDAPGVSTINSILIEFTSAPPGAMITGVKMTAPTVMIPTMTPSTGGTSVVITNFPGIKSHADATFEITLSGVTSNCTSVSFNVNANSGNSYPGGDEFVDQTVYPATTSVNCDGVLKCPSLPATTPGIYNYKEISGANVTSLLRWENKDGSVCIPTQFNVSISNSDRTVNIFWNQLQPYAALQSETTWPPELVDPTDAFLPKPTKFSVDGSGPWVAPTCLSSNPSGALWDAGEHHGQHHHD